MRVFLAGASGAIGNYLVRQLVERGHRVTATTHTAAKVERLRAAGADPVVVDGLDAAGIREAVARAEPEAILHEMTALAGPPNMRRFDEWAAVTSELRTRGTDHLLAAARAAGIRRVVAQSYAGTNQRQGSALKTEDEPVDPNPPRAQRRSTAAIRYLEQAVRGMPEGIVLRYGNLYGPGASEPLVEMVRARKMPIIGDGAGVWSWIHLQDVAVATVAALERGAPGVYNIVDDEPARVRDWLPYLAEVVGARPPLHVPVWLGYLAAGQVGVRLMTQSRGASNEKARRELGWAPVWRSWRDGFRAALTAPAPAPAARRAEAPTHGIHG
ncbi:MAG TPA: NAD(P)-dependent oxidoreductase [Kofleriaceae bacterium]|jgi:nucleoside-diphosphate-sugar epimerase|nr:NAD(P)-dependent oxidoreductase [Kofleriaceae bacterium]